MTVSRTVSLGEICGFVGGGTPSRKQPEYFQGDIPWATVKDFKSFLITDTEDHISEAAIADSATNMVDPGTVLLVSRVGLGKVAIAGCRLAINQDIKAITPTDNILPEYLFWFLLSKAGDIQRMGAGATVKGVTLNDIKSITMPVPPLPEQRRIVDLLCRADGIVRLRREAEKKAAELIPALFLDMFGDPATNPKGWAKLPLGELCTRITDGTHQPPKFQESGIPFIFVANIVKGELSLDAAKFISDETYAELTRRCPIEEGDVLYSTVGSYGVPVKVDTDERFSFQRHIAHLKPRRDRLDADFLVGMLSTPALKAQADMAARGIAQKTINLGEIRKFQAIAPPIEDQRRFALQVTAAASIRSQQSAATAKAQATFDALLAQTFKNRGSQ
jgi:type I restriction enzyme S subunit